MERTKQRNLLEMANIKNNTLIDNRIIILIKGNWDQFYSWK